MRIVFMGTPDFAVPSLEALVHSRHEVILCVCQPDRPRGRGKHFTPCPVKETAEKYGIPVFQPERIKRPEEAEKLRALAPDLFVTAAFGQLLSQEILDIPRLGTVNVHASLLPRHRGAAPIHWAILSGDKTTGVTTMMTDLGMDTGDMLLSREIPIGPEDTAGTITDRLAELGAQLLLETLDRLEEGTLSRTPQDPLKATTEPKLTKELGRIDFAQSPEEIDLKVRGTSPWPGAYTETADGVMKIFGVAPAKGTGVPGTVLVSSPRDGLIVACGTGAVEITQLQMPGAKRMPARDYLRGHTIEVGTELGKA